MADFLSPATTVVGSPHHELIYTEDSVQFLYWSWWHKVILHLSCIQLIMLCLITILFLKLCAPHVPSDLTQVCLVSLPLEPLLHACVLVQLPYLATIQLSLRGTSNIDYVSLLLLLVDDDKVRLQWRWHPGCMIKELGSQTVRNDSDQMLQYLVTMDPHHRHVGLARIETVLLCPNVAYAAPTPSVSHWIPIPSFVVCHC